MVSTTTTEIGVGGEYPEYGHQVESLSLGAIRRAHRVQYLPNVPIEVYVMLRSGAGAHFPAWQCFLATFTCTTMSR